MPLHAKSISVSVAVALLFAIAFVGWFAGLEPFVCCKRAMIGAIIAYSGMTIAIKIINNIFISALVRLKMEQHNKDANEHGN